MNVVICNMGYSGYWVACWRELAKRANINLKIYSPNTRYPYSANFLAGLPITILSENEMSDAKGVCDNVVSDKPDVLIIGGWASSTFRALVRDKRLAGVKKILIIDSAWTGSGKQILSRFLLWRWLRKFDGIIVAGERGRQYARWLGFRSEQIFTSIYGYDADAFEPCMRLRRERHASWPKRFCFVGRYAEIKGLKTLLLAYDKYKSWCCLERKSEPWPLDCFGTGVLKELMEKTDGVVDHGFIQPEKLPSVLVDEGVFILPSLHEPWGVALMEAAGAGLPIICSDAVASGLDAVRPKFNGAVFPVGNVDRLAMALIKMHDAGDRLQWMGENSAMMARAYSPRVWCDRWMEVFDVLVG